MSAVSVLAAAVSNETSSDIAAFYNDKSIFITGATGFLGKCLIEKVLRSCTRVRKIYLLVRAKKGKTPQQRLDEIVKCKVKAFL
jgi:fatty acyl-CoA reductase